MITMNECFLQKKKRYGKLYIQNLNVHCDFFIFCVYFQINFQLEYIKYNVTLYKQWLGPNLHLLVYFCIPYLDTLHFLFTSKKKNTNKISKFVQQHTVFKVRDTKPMKVYTKEMRHK